MTVPAWGRAPGRGRYARSEREARFLLAAVPPDAGAPRHIEDIYLIGTTLRVRRVTDGETTVCKLTQKVRTAAGEPPDVALTNVYLTEDEYRLLSSLPGRPLRKTRRPWTWCGREWAVDVRGSAIEFGHHIPEDAPEATIAALREFLSD